LISKFICEEQGFKMGKNVFDIPAAQSWIKRWVDTLIYGKYSQTITNISTARPIFFCKVKPNTSTIINLKVVGPSFKGSINLAITVGLKTELNKSAMSVLATSIPAFFSGSTVYLATSVDGLLEDYIFIGFSVPATGTFTVGMQAVSSERNGVLTVAYSVPLTNVPNVQFKVSDGYLAGYPTIKPIRELDAFRQWSATYQYVAEDPVFFHGSAYFANPAMVPDVGESPGSAPLKWIQLARSDPGPMDITEGARTPQLFYQPGLIISNTTALKLRKAHQDQGMRYLSSASKVYHLDGDLLDQDQQNPLNILIKIEFAFNDESISEFPYNDIMASAFAFNMVSAGGIFPHFIGDDSVPEPPITMEPAIPKKPFKEVAESFYGSYSVSLVMPDNTGLNTLDFWFKLATGGGVDILDLELPTGEYFLVELAYEEPFWNDNSGTPLPDNFLYNINVLQPGTLVYNERDIRSGLSAVLGYNGNVQIIDFGISDQNLPQINRWNHIALEITESQINIFINGIDRSFNRLSSGFGGDTFININRQQVPIVLDELLFDWTTAESFSRYNQISQVRLPWAYHEWAEGWLTVYGDSADRIDSNLALFLFPIGSVITQTTIEGEYNLNQSPWKRFHNFTEDQFVLQGEVIPIGGNGERTRFWQRVS
jgi:hypothetical protein